MRSVWMGALAATCAAMGSFGCSLIAGIDGDYSTARTSGSGGAVGSSSGSSSSGGGDIGGSSGTSTSGGGVGGSSSTSTSSGIGGGGSGGGGNGGNGGNGGSGGSVICQAGDMMPCYSGPPATQGVGLCHVGQAKCSLDGMSFGPCEGEVTPTMEACNTTEDEDCDGLIPDTDSGCLCVPGTLADCYTGPAGTENVGLCHGGKETCDVSGLSFGSCMAEATPTAELCDTPDDEDCDNLIPDIQSGCLCIPGNVMGCYSGPVGTDLVGVCHGGQQTCDVSGLSFGPCANEVTPTPEDCSTGQLDEDCDGTTLDADVGCLCAPGSSAACYTGPPGTLNVGVCLGGQHQCAPSGTSFGPCVGEVTPMAEVCSTGQLDEDCDGTTLDADVGCVCAPGSTASCYTGPAGTAGVGQCKAGLKTCNAQGTGYDACLGQVLPSVENCATAMIDEDCNGNASACSGGKVWVKSFGDVAIQSGTAITLDPQGNPVITGDFAGTVSFGGASLTSAGAADIYVAKLDRSLGSFLSQKSAGGAGDEQGFSVAVDSAGNTAVTGQFTSQFDFGCGVSTTVQSNDALAARLDAAGACAWSNRFGGTGNQAGNDVAVDAAGSMFFAGSFGNNINFGPGAKSSQGGSDAFLVKFSPAGSYLWDKTFGDSFDQFGTSVALDAAGNVLIAGNFQNTVTIGGTLHTSAGGTDIFIAKYTTDGAFVWGRRLGGSGNDQVKAIAVGDSGNVVLVGTTSGMIDLGGGVQVTNTGVVDILVGELGPDNTALWAKTFGAAGNSDAGNGIDVDSNGHVVITGGFTGSINFGGGALTSSGGSDIFVAKLNGSGGHLWSRRFGDANANQAGNSVAVNDSGAPFIIGTYDGSLNVDGTFVTSSGAGDIVVMSLLP